MALGLRNTPAQWTEFLQDTASSSGVGPGSRELARCYLVFNLQRVKERTKNNESVIFYDQINNVQNGLKLIRKMKDHGAKIL